MNNHLRILHVNTSDTGGGAERNSAALAAGCREAGHEAWLAVGRKRGDGAHTLPMSNDHPRRWARALCGMSALLEPAGRRVKPVRRSRRWLEKVARPRNYLNEVRGYEDFHYPQTRALLDLPPQPPDLLHLHNLHGGYFDLRRLAAFSQQLPCVVTLRDEWLLTGHCAYTQGCDRWMTGCGACPDLGIYPAIRRDATARNWQVKAAIYRASRLYVAAPSRWLLDEAKRSMLAAGMADGRVIPNGIDTTLFSPCERALARRELNLPEDRNILLTAANRVRSNRFKDWPTLRRAMDILAERAPDTPLLFIALGEDAAEERVGPIEIRFVPFHSDPQHVARHFQAADLFLHAARSENFPTTVLEALSCATPVVATAVGGIPEQIRDINGPSVGETATGVLVPSAEAEAIAHWVQTLLADPPLLARMGEQGRADAVARFGFDRMLHDYLAYYRDALAGHMAQAGPGR